MERSQPKTKAKPKKKPIKEETLFETSARGWAEMGRGAKVGLKMIKKAWNGRQRK
jgi:hypothetical protein